MAHITKPLHKGGGEDAETSNRMEHWHQIHGVGMASVSALTLHQCPCQHDVFIEDTCLGFHLEQKAPIITDFKPLFTCLLQIYSSYIQEILCLIDSNSH